MKKTALALTLVLALFSTAIITQKTSVTEANPNWIKPSYCDITIHSPQNIIYETGNILLNFTAKTNHAVPSESLYFYNLESQDLQSSVEIEDLQIGEENITGDTVTSYIEYTIRGQVELPMLAEGPHSLKVFAGHFYGDGKIYGSSSHNAATAWFIVDKPNTEFSASSITSTMSKLTIISPQSKIYSSNVLNLTATAQWSFVDINEMSYSIDGAESRWLSSNKPETEIFNPLNGIIIGSVNLTELNEGSYSITVDLKGRGYFPETREFMEQVTTYFTIDVSPPILSSLSVINKTYNHLDLELNFTVSEPTSWMGYSLDNEANVTLTENTILNLTEGTHKITVYANDTAGNMVASETIYFTTEQGLPTIPIAVGVVTAAVACLGLLFYRERK